MESQTKAEVNEIPKEPGTNERSTIEFPYSDIDNAVEIVLGVRDVGGTTCDYDQLAAHMQLEAKGGGFRIRVTGAKTYGLLINERGGRITLTELGRHIIDSQYARAAKAEAFLKVALYAKVFENYKGRELPPPAALERALIGFGVGSKVAKNARQVLMRSAQQCAYFELNPDRLTAPPTRGSTLPEQPRKEDPYRGGGTGNGNGNGGDGGAGHPLIEGLVQTLPKPNESWSGKDRYNWLTMANSIFKIIYQSADDSDVLITFSAMEKIKET